ncbi:1918_t:CDS:2 [Gigaspora margarita]|uniref:1918_t:CDS:1 n=1 Tax=Gigaspora margarita TaxID=4874 RepID=A0ABN7V7Y5_GIGMA|nr:1918_t:CDS:2 [Gigaspora margarita]
MVKLKDFGQLWTLSNLSRAAMIDGVWPYNYDECDVGAFSYTYGQRLNKCTCPGQGHPSPRNGRGVPEIDLLETIDDDSLISHEANKHPRNRVVPYNFGVELPSTGSIIKVTTEKKNPETQKIVDAEFGFLMDF